MRMNSMLNTPLPPKTVGFCRGMGWNNPNGKKKNVQLRWWSEQPWQSQIKVPSFLLIRGEIEPAKYYQNHFLVSTLSPGHRSSSKMSLGIFSRTLHHCMRPKIHRSSFTRMSRGSFPIKKSSIWSNLMSQVSATSHQSLEILKVKLQKQWVKSLWKYFMTHVRLFLNVFN